MTDLTSLKPRATRGAWMALLAALLGWLFDGFEIGMFPLVGQPALAELLPNAPKASLDQWFGVITAVFLVGAASGGVLFGWLGDRIGRVRAMSLSILTYALFTGLSGFATAAWQVAVLRFVASLGMGGEWSLGVALVNEIWPQRSRALIAGLIGAASNVGIGLVPVVSLTLLTRIDAVRTGLTAVGFSDGVAEKLLRNQAWRLIMIAGALPALLIFFIRIFVPESGKWQRERDRGATSHWATTDLLGVLAGTAGTGVVIVVWSPATTSPLLRAAGTLGGIAIALIGFLYPVVMYLSRSIAAGQIASQERKPILGRLLLGAGLSGVALVATWGSLQWAPRWAIDLAKLTPGPNHAKDFTQLASAGGAVVGAALAALVADKLGRRLTYTLLCFASIASLLALYQLNDHFGARFLTCVFFAGGTTAAFYGWFPLYLPELFRTSLRATSQGFAYNFGRVLAAIGTLQTATVMGFFGGSFPKAGSVLCFIYLIGVVIIWFGPETKGKPLPE